ncbi:MAG TPA: SgcJ/EcaC family oxidoreductase [Gemmatimonadaceae bacterium]|nr:SgcJ/EcaC family oxidoreductase [Gemmatimonadaceae bacterium]
MPSTEPTLSTPDVSRSASNTPGSLQREITVANARFMEALRNADPAAVAACYTRDAQLLPSNSEVVAGTDAIAGFWGSVLGMGIAEARLETLEVEGQGDLAMEVGRYTLTTADGAEADRGKYVVVWHRAGGSWKLHRDIWNTSRPPQGG